MKITKLYPPKNNSFVLEDLPFRSQTLFGALANCYVKLFGDASFPYFLKLFQKGRIGSIFPAIKIGEKNIFFLPKPCLSKMKTDNEKGDSISKKKIKKIRWLSFSAMQYLSNSIKQVGEEFFHSVDFLNDFFTIGNEFLIRKDELSPEICKKIENMNFYQKTNIVRVSVARFGENSTPFEQVEMSFCDTKINLGKDGFMDLKLFLYFPEKVESNEKWNAAKHLFADEGIGGKRYLGKGSFDKIETSDMTFATHENPKLYLLLSNLIPHKEDLGNILSYDIGIDDGFITFGYASTMKKDALFFIKEGSVLNAQVEGKIIQQRFNDKTIYRYGKALLLPLGGGNE